LFSIVYKQQYYETMNLYLLRSDEITFDVFIVQQTISSPGPAGSVVVFSRGEKTFRLFRDVHATLNEMQD